MDSALLTQGRVIGALILRETRTTFGSSQLGYLWAILNPTLGITVLVFIFTTIGREPPFGQSLALFFATGFLAFDWYRKLTSSLMVVFDNNKSLLSYPLVQAFDTVVARYTLISATHLLIVILFFSGLIFFSLAEMPAHPEKLLLAFAITSFLGLGVGISNAVIYSVFKTWKHIEGIMKRPMFFMSGIFYIPQNFPKEIVDILAWNPVLHCVEWVREGYYPNYNSFVLDEFYLICWALGTILVGLAGERLYRKKRI